MNKSKAIKIAIAFKRGVAFVRGMQQLAQDADIPEGARWITIGATEGDDGRIKFAKDVVDWVKSKGKNHKIKRG